MRVKISFLFAILTFAFLISCGQQADTVDSSLSELTIGYSRLRISLPIFVAQEKGLFEKHGIKADLLVYDTAQPLMQALVEGKIDLAGYTALPITYNGMLRSGTQLHFLTTMVEDQEHRISYLLRAKTPEEQEPRIKDIQDLKGKRIGILPTIAYKVWIEAILKANNIQPDEVIIQQIEPLLQPQALASGGIDALFTNDPAATSALAKDLAETITDFVEVPKYLGEPFAFGSFNVSKAWADSHPDEFKRFTAALDEAIDFVNTNPEEAKVCMKPYLADVFKPHVELYPDARYLPTYQSSEKTFQKIAQEYFEMKITPKALDLSGLVYTSQESAASN